MWCCVLVLLGLRERLHGLLEYLCPDNELFTRILFVRYNANNYTMNNVIMRLIKEGTEVRASGLLFTSVSGNVLVTTSKLFNATFDYIRSSSVAGQKPQAGSGSGCSWAWGRRRLVLFDLQVNAQVLKWRTFRAIRTASFPGVLLGLLDRSCLAVL